MKRSYPHRASLGKMKLPIVIRVGSSTTSASAEEMEHPEKDQLATFPHVFYAIAEDVNQSPLVELNVLIAFITLCLANGDLDIFMVMSLYSETAAYHMNYGSPTSTVCSNK